MKSNAVLKEEYVRMLEEQERKLALAAKYREENLIEFFDTPPNPGPNPLQAELLEAWLDPLYKVFTYTGANRIGKTTILAILSISTVIGKFLWSGKRLHFPHNKPRKVRIVGQDWEKHIKSVLVPELWKWWPKSRPLRGGRPKKNNTGVEYLWVDDKTGGSIEIMSNLQDSDLHEGWQGDLVSYDEPPKRDIRVANARGLIDRQGRELFTMTLLKEAWIHQEIINAVDEKGRPDPTVFSVDGDIYSNVGFGITREGVRQFEKTLTEDEVSARIHGKPSYMSGLVYPTFKRKMHLKPRFEIPLDWIVDIAIDVHPRENQAILFQATAPDNRRYLCYEVWDHGDGTWIGEQIIRLITGNALRVGQIICDPLAKGDKNDPNTTFDKIDMVLYKYGYVLRTASKDKSSGILEVKKHLLGPNNEPSVFIFDDMVRTIKEVEGYMYDEDSQKPCVTGDTVIDTPTGRYRIKDLEGKDLYVYCYSHRYGRIDVKKATDIRKTGENKEIWKLTMDRGVLFATPDHLVMLRNGNYRQLRDLKSYDSLMPLYRTMTVDGYSKINPNDHRSKRRANYPSEHRFVYECVYGMPPNDKQVHHIDGNHLNHDPDNLCLTDAAEHQYIHIHNGIADIICLNCGQTFRQKKTWQKHCSSKCRQQYADKRRKRVWEKHVICPSCDTLFAQNVGGQIYCSVTCRQKAYRERRSASLYNHKVLSVEFYGYEDVYNMEVEENHNFVANGIVVHNCDKNDHMMENWYRLMLLDTQWYKMEEEDEDQPQGRSTANKVTGY